MNKKKLYAIVGTAVAGVMGVIGYNNFIGEGNVCLYGVPNDSAFIVQSHNSQFTQYCRERITGAQVNALLSDICSSNIVNIRNRDVGRLIRVIAPETEIKMSGYEIYDDEHSIVDDQSICIPTKIQKKANQSKIYKTTVESYYENIEYIKEIKIECVK